MDRREPQAVSGRATTSAAVLTLFALTLFGGALLLFWIQPLVAKMATPLLGGSPAVWNTCMVFFQTALAAGYAYAYALVRWLTPPRQLLVHGGVLLAGAGFLPIAVSSAVEPGGQSTPVGWLLMTLTASVAMPFLAVAATAPLLQCWFARTRHPHAPDPYFLYGASNLGSVGALLAFPFAFERLLGNEQQTWAWSGTYVAVAALIGICGLLSTRADGRRPVSAGSADPTGAIGWRWLRWVAYAAVPSSLLIGVTSHVTTDIAAAPLLWVMPLSLYLFSFIAVFTRRPLFDHGRLIRLAPLAVVILAATMMIEARLGMALPTGVRLALHGVVFFCLCLLGHGALYRDRPAAGRLAQFYLFIAFGGMLGGITTALLAPIVFTGVYEYPLALAVACLLLPAGGRAFRPRDAVGAAVIVAIVLGFDALVSAADDAAVRKLIVLAVSTPAVAIALASRSRPAGFALCIAALLVGALLDTRQADVVWRGRSFFGAYRVGDTTDGLRLLYHGTTVHGAQWTDPARGRRPATYYAADSPVAEIIARRRATAGLDHVGVVGLGVGSLACYREPGEHWRFYEIDPLVVWIAAGSGLFRFLADCAPASPVTVADGRLGLARDAAERFDLLIVDAFTSDAIPIHLLTRDAFAVYLARLDGQGVLVLHISNRHVDLAPVVGRLAADLGLVARLANNTPQRGGFASTASDWVVLARRAETLDRLRLGARWWPLPGDDGGAVWTDDHSNIVEAILWW